MRVKRPRPKGPVVDRSGARPRLDRPAPGSGAAGSHGRISNVARNGLATISYVAIAIALACYLYPQHSWKDYRNVNEQARLYLVKAVVEEGVLNIDSGIKTYGDLQDKAARDGHFYCDKPIGLSFLAVPVYWLLHLAGRMVGYAWTLQGMRYALTVFCVSIPTILVLLLLDRYWRRLGAPAWLAGFGLLAYGLGTMAFPYSTQFVGHQLAAVLAFSHFFLTRDFDARTPAWKLLLAGALAGFGAITDYFSALIHVAILASYATKIRPFRAWAPLLAGGAIAFSPLPLYNLIAFGSPTRMSYGQEALPVFKELHGTGFFGVTLPRAESIAGLLVSPAKGLFWLSPFLVLGLLGLVAAVRDRERRRDGIVMSVGVGVILWLALSVVDWRAGWTVGPRHMVSMLPFLATGVVLAVERYPRLGGALVVSGLLSMILLFAPTMTLPAFDVNFVHPITDQALFLLRQGIVSANPGLSLGLPGAWSLLLPGLLVAGGIVYVLYHALRARAVIDPVAIVACLVTLGAAGWLVSAAYPRQPEPITMYFQARLLKLVDAPRLAGSWYERAVERSPDANIRRQMADRLYPEAADLYGGMGDFDAVRRIADSWARIDPANPKLHEIEEALKRGPSR